MWNLVQCSKVDLIYLYIPIVLVFIYLPPVSCLQIVLFFIQL